MPSSYLDIDGYLAADSDSKVPSQKAVKTYVTSAVGGVASNTVPAFRSIVDITSSQTWTVPAGVGLVKIVAIGGGGNGGDASSNGNYFSAGGGGGGGGLSFKLLNVTPGQSIVCTISSGNVIVTHSLSSLNMSANKGGSGGAGNTSGVGGAGGSGGTASGGDRNIQGGLGASGTANTTRARGGSGGAIGGNSGYTNSAADSAQVWMGASFFFSANDSGTSTNSYYTILSCPDFAQYLLGNTIFKTRLTDRETDNYLGFPGVKKSSSPTAQSGSETGGGAGGGDADGQGGNGGNIGAGAGGCTRSNASGTTTSTSIGGAAHVFILY